MNIETTEQSLKLLDRELSSGIDSTSYQIQHDETVTKDQLYKYGKELVSIRHIANQLDLTDTLSYIDKFIEELEG